MKVGSFVPEQDGRVLYAIAGDDCSLHYDLESLTPKQQADRRENRILTCALSGQTAENLTSRQAIAVFRHDALSGILPESLLEGATQSELMDSIRYLLFPNFAPWAGSQSQITYRYRPIDSNPNTCVMDLYFLDRFPEGTPRPPDAGTVCLDFDDGFAEVSCLGGLAAIFDQDANNLPEVQRGLIASHCGTVITAEYQECRIRHFHQTLDHYLEDEFSSCKL